MKDEQDLIKEIDKRLPMSRHHFSSWRTDAREDFDFTAGEQWSEEDKALLQEELRPCITFNRIGATLDAVAGNEITNRQEVRFVPREQGDIRVNEVLTGAAEWIRDECDAEDEESDAFMDTLICGMGWTNTFIDQDSDPDGEIKIERIDPFEMYPDPYATKRNLSDARWVIRVREMDIEEARGLWPDKLDQIEQGDAEDISLDDFANKPQEILPGDRYKGSDRTTGRLRDGKIRVAEYQWCDRTPVMRVMSPETGEWQDVELKAFNKLNKQLEERGLPPIPGVKQNRKKWYRAFKASGIILESGPCPFPDGPTYRCITGKRDRNTNTWFGLVRVMKDPQRWANKWLSQILHIINSTAKGGVMIESTAVDDLRKFEESWASPSGVSIVRDGAIARGAVQQKPQTQYPSGLDRLMEFAVTSIRDVTGVNIELLGLADRQQAGVLEYQRKQAGMTILAPLFDSLRRYRKEQGRVLLYFINEYIPEGTLVRISSEQGKQYVPLIKRPGVARFDVIVDEAATSPNQKDKTWQMLTQLLPAIKEILTPEMWMALVKYSPLPADLVDEIQKIYQKMQQQPQQPPPEVQKEQMRLEVKKQEMAMDAQNDQQKMALEAKNMEASQSLEAWKVSQEIQLMWEKAKAEMEIAQFKHSSEMQLRTAESERDAANAMELGKAEVDAKRQPQTVVRFDAQEALEGVAESVGTMAEQTVNALETITSGQQMVAETMLKVAQEIGKPRRTRVIRGKDGRASEAISEVVQ